MANYQTILEENGEAWGDKVRIITLSTDKDATKAKQHVNAQGWNKPIHYWQAKSLFKNIYKFDGIPHMMIIDTNGKVAFKGHPASRTNLVQDFTTLLKGESITGEDCAKAEDKVEEGFKTVTEDEIMDMNS